MACPPDRERLTAHGSRLTAHGSRLTAHGSRLTAHLQVRVFVNRAFFGLLEVYLLSLQCFAVLLEMPLSELEMSL